MRHPGMRIRHSCQSHSRASINRGFYERTLRHCRPGMNFMNQGNAWKLEPEDTMVARSRVAEAGANGRRIAAVVRVPRLNYELPSSRRGEKFAWSIALHAVGIFLLLKLAPMFSGPRVQPVERSLVTPIYTPQPAPKIVAPPPQVMARLQPKIEPPAPAPVAPKIEIPKPPEIARVPPPPVVKTPEPKPEPKKEVITRTFTEPPVPKPEIRKKEVVTDTFASGSSAQPTIHAPARQVQTGGFGDPNGVAGTSESKRTLTAASVGSFDLPSGPGKGNGTGGPRGREGVVANSGFGNGPAGPGENSGRRGPVISSGFSDRTASATGPVARTESKPKVVPVELLFKPKPEYTTEARQLRVEGEVLVEVVFAASGELRVQKVVRGLGHGLDESALRAARQIRFSPARKNGQPYDSSALVHIVFELAE
jgi:TonB family protein